jgi:hypothetical protein
MGVASEASQSALWCIAYSSSAPGVCRSMK